MTDVRSTIKDAAYVGIGFGVLAFQKAQVRRQELQKRFEASIGDAKGGFGKLSDDVQDRIKLVEERLEVLSKQVDAAADDFEERLDKALDQVQDRLPEQAKELFGKARTAGKDARTQLRELAKSAQPKATTAA
jgi:hypothetical protein